MQWKRCHWSFSMVESAWLSGSLSSNAFPYSLAPASSASEQDLEGVLGKLRHFIDDELVPMEPHVKHHHEVPQDIANELALKARAAGIPSLEKWIDGPRNNCFSNAALIEQALGGTLDCLIEGALGWTAPAGSGTLEERSYSMPPMLGGPGSFRAVRSAGRMIGRANRLLEISVSAMDRRSSIRKHHLVRLGEMAADVVAARALLDATAQLLDSGAGSSVGLAAMRLFVSEMLERTIDGALLLCCDQVAAIQMAVRRIASRGPFPFNEIEADRDLVVGTLLQKRSGAGEAGRPILYAL
jgi:hypothetical protein